MDNVPTSTCQMMYQHRHRAPPNRRLVVPHHSHRDDVRTIPHPASQVRFRGVTNGFGPHSLPSLTTLTHSAQALFQSVDFIKE